MNGMRLYLSVAVVLMLLCAGCAEPKAPAPAANQDNAKLKPATNSLVDETITAGQGAELPATSSNTTTDASQQQQPATEQVVAGVGVGKKGRALDQYQKDSVQKIISTPALALFQTKERIVFEIQIPHALDLYKAEHGEAPRSHEAFMRDIIEFNDIKLPELPAGQRYIYDPQREELMVERPVTQ
jgi:hypothetical protein